MPHYRRSYTKGGTYFFTVVTHQRQTFLLDEPFRLALRASIAEVRKTLPFKVEAWVLLPDHLHCIWTLPEGDDNYSLRWLLINKGVSQRVEEYKDPKRISASRRKRNESSIWQRRFWEHQLWNDQDFARHMDYVHFNPVKHGYVQRPSDWPYSTLHRLVKEGLYEVGWGEGVVWEEDIGEEWE